MQLGTMTLEDAVEAYDYGFTTTMKNGQILMGTHCFVCGEYFEAPTVCPMVCNECKKKYKKEEG